MLTVIDRWRSFAERLRASSVQADQCFLKLVRRYSKPRRFYHTLEGHINACIEEFAQVSHYAIGPLSVEGALWMHDAYYHTRSHRNEWHSARWSQQLLCELGTSPTFVNQVVELIMASRHTDEPSGNDAQLLCSIDLSILGKPEEVFDQYERNIRKEYHWVPDQMFREKRAEILEGFLKRDRIFSHPVLHAKYETQAQYNLTRSIASLRSRPR